MLKSLKKAIRNRRLEVELLKNNRSLYRRELNEFREAREAWHDHYRPTTWDMQEIYREAVKNDAHLRAIINTRIHLALANEFALYVKDKKIALGLLKAPWFRKKMRLDMESIFYGYTLLYPVLEGGQIVDVKPIDRGHFIPQRDKLVKSPYHSEGLPLEGLEKYLWLAQLGDDPFGLLETAASPFKSKNIAFFKPSSSRTSCARRYNSRKTPSAPTAPCCSPCTKRPCATHSY